ncbi:hypothetical protein CRUP_016378 [Coryphaenoides rupestris]|nr:hypothetical protein CRUP_016378 [Coryphaenoides rupestris]
MFQVLGGRARLLAPGGPVVLQAVRGRKSRHDPPARSKEGRIQRLEFKEEVLRRRYEEETGSMAEERARQDAAEHRVLMAWNDAENLRLLKIRQVRVQKEALEAEQRKQEVILQREQEMQSLIEAKAQEVMQLEEEAKNFITLENLDERIEAALDGPPSNYNYAIDREGRVVKQTVLE